MKTFPKFDTAAFLSGKAPRLDTLDGLDAVILPFEQSLAALNEVERECYEERASIKQFDAGMTQQQAEREALCEIIELRGYL